jgi:hypothetical protein
LFFIVAVSAAFSFGRKETVNNPQNTPVIVETVDTANQANTSENNTTTITGTIQIYGSEPHTFVGIIDNQDRTEYAVHPPAIEQELRGLQGRLIEFTVIKQDEPLGFGGLQLKGGTVTVVEWRIIR